MFATGPVSGNSIWGSCRYGVFTKSPQTGFYAESYAGGKTPEAIDSCGFDAIVIHGKLSVALHRKLEDTGAVITEEEMDSMVRDYYRIRGWSN